MSKRRRRQSVMRSEACITPLTPQLYPQALRVPTTDTNKSRKGGATFESLTVGGYFCGQGVII